MNLRKVIQRFLVPSLVVTLIYLWKYGCKISPRAEVELSKNLRIGAGTEIGSFTKIKATDGELKIGKNVSIGTGCFISADSGGVEIGDFSMISPNVSIVGNNYRYDKLNIPIAKQDKTSKGIVIGADVWIGVGCVILDGVTIGDHCIIAPNSVVTRPIKSGYVAQGSPAESIFERR